MLESAPPPAGEPDPGWYPDPMGGARERYWDGVRWTLQVRQVENVAEPGGVEPVEPREPDPERASPANPGASDGGNAFTRAWDRWPLIGRVSFVIGATFVGFLLLGSVLELTGYETEEEREARLAEESRQAEASGERGEPGSDDPALSPEEESCDPECLTVTAVVDGDSVETDRFPRVRLIGIDTPEEGRCGDNAATNYTRRELLGETVRYELGVERKDRFGRTLAYLFKGGSEMHNLDLVQRGLAFALTIPPNTKYAPEFELAERAAKRALRGSWLLCPSGPRPPRPKPNPPDPNRVGGGGGSSSESDDRSEDSGSSGDVDIPFVPGE